MTAHDFVVCFFVARPLDESFWRFAFFGAKQDDFVAGGRNRREFRVCADFRNFGQFCLGNIGDSPHICRVERDHFAIDGQTETGFSIDVNGGFDAFTRGEYGLRGDEIGDLDLFFGLGLFFCLTAFERLIMGLRLILGLCLILRLCLILCLILGLHEVLSRGL